MFCCFFPLTCNNLCFKVQCSDCINHVRGSVLLMFTLDHKFGNGKRRNDNENKDWNNFDPNVRLLLKTKKSDFDMVQWFYGSSCFLLQAAVYLVQKRAPAQRHTAAQVLIWGTPARRIYTSALWNVWSWLADRRFRASLIIFFFSPGLDCIQFSNHVSCFKEP